jgi:hypothetical protein
MKLTDSTRGGGFLEQLSDYEICKKALISFFWGGGVNFKNIFMYKSHIKLQFLPHRKHTYSPTGRPIG